MNAFRASVLVCVGLLAVPTSAAVTMETVPVGNPGNAGELSGAGVEGGWTPEQYPAAARICGAVAYGYNIGKYEVTAGQYTAFLNAVAKIDTYGLYNTSMADTSNGCGIQRIGGGTQAAPFVYALASDNWVNRPVNYVSSGDAERFANWLHNGQLTGNQDLSTTEDGAYYLNGATTDAAVLAVTRKANWKWALASEDEWYKAAYYKGGSTNAEYWDYPTSSNSINTDMANYNMTVGHPTDVGSYSYPSPYGTYDQGGNLYEWEEAIITDQYGSRRGLRGGAFDYYADDLLAPGRHSGGYPTFESDDIGFRVSEVPEPTTLSFLALGALALTRRRK